MVVTGPTTIALGLIKDRLGVELDGTVWAPYGQRSRHTPHSVQALALMNFSPIDRRECVRANAGRNRAHPMRREGTVSPAASDFAKLSSRTMKASKEASSFSFGESLKS
jgi:hypothetical protein